MVVTLVGTLARAAVPAARGDAAADERASATAGCGVRARSIYAFLFAPIVVLILFSFNDSRRELRVARVHPRLVPEAVRRTDDLLDALRVTLQVAAIAVVVATVLGSLLGLGLARLRSSAAAAPPTRSSCCRWSRPRSSWASACCCSSAELFGANGSIGQIVDRPHHVLHLVRGRSSCGRGRSRMDPRLEEAARDLGAIGVRARSAT